MTLHLMHWHQLFLPDFFFIRLISEDVFELIHKFLDIFKLSINGSKADISHSIQPMEFVHHLLPDFRAPHLSLPSLLKMELDAVYDLLNQVDADRPLLAGPLETIEDLNAIESLSSPILLDDQRQGILCPLAGRKSLLATQTFPPPADRLFILAKAGIDHFTLRVTAERTFHNDSTAESRRWIVDFFSLLSTFHFRLSVEPLHFNPRVF